MKSTATNIVLNKKVHVLVFYTLLAERPSVQLTVVLTAVPRTYFQYIDRFSACGMMRNGQMLCLQVSVVSVLR